MDCTVFVIQEMFLNEYKSNAQTLSEMLKLLISCYHEK